MTVTSAAPTATPWLSDEQQRVWRSYLLGSTRLAERLDADLGEFGLDLAEYKILVTLSELPERRARMSELADAVHQSRSRLTHTASRLESAGLLERISCPTDRRGVWAHLTEAGYQLLATAAPAHVRSVRGCFVDQVSAEDYAAVGRVFAAVAEASSV